MSRNTDGLVPDNTVQLSHIHRLGSGVPEPAEGAEAVGNDCKVDGEDRGNGIGLGYDV